MRLVERLRKPAQADGGTAVWKIVNESDERQESTARQSEAD
jgi:hypothetical protein